MRLDLGYQYYILLNAVFSYSRLSVKNRNSWKIAVSKRKAMEATFDAVEKKLEEETSVEKKDFEFTLLNERALFQNEKRIKLFSN